MCNTASGFEIRWLNQILNTGSPSVAVDCAVSSTSDLRDDLAEVVVERAFLLGWQVSVSSAC